MHAYTHTHKHTYTHLGLSERAQKTEDDEAGPLVRDPMNLQSFIGAYAGEAVSRYTCVTYLYVCMCEFAYRRHT